MIFVHTPILGEGKRVQTRASVIDRTRWIALVWLLLWPLAPASAQESGFTWTVMRYAYVLDDKGLPTGTFEIERQAHDAQAARTGARVDLSYVAGQETIEILDAATLKADGRKIPVGPDRILDIAPQVPRDVALYNDTRTKSVVFPDVAAGRFHSLRLSPEALLHAAGPASPGPHRSGPWRASRTRR